MAKSKEMALYYESNDDAQKAKVKSVLVRLGIRIKNITLAESEQTLGYLLGRKEYAFSEEKNQDDLIKPMLILAEFTEKRLDILLRELKKENVKIPYKAIITDTNIGWTMRALYHELARENEAMIK